MYKSKSLKKNYTVLLLAIIALAMTIVGYADQPTAPQWGMAYTTPGTELILEEVEHTTIQNNTAVVYRLKASGLPKGKIYTLWTKPLGESPVVVETGFLLDESGRLVSDRKTPLEKILLQAIDFAKGQPYEVGLISTDQTIKAFAKKIPFPLEARGYGGPCRLTMEIVSPDGHAFAVYGEGFDRNEEIETESQSDGGVLKSKNKTSEDGTFVAILLPAVVGKKTGSSSFKAVGKFCHATVEYQWGTAALKPY